MYVFFHPIHIILLVLGEQDLQCAEFFSGIGAVAGGFRYSLKKLGCFAMRPVALYVFVQRLITYQTNPHSLASCSEGKLTFRRALADFQMQSCIVESKKNTIHVQLCRMYLAGTPRSLEKGYIYIYTRPLAKRVCYLFVLQGDPWTIWMMGAHRIFWVTLALCVA